jgi:hypothetical protein
MASTEQGIFEALGIDMDNEVTEAASSGFAEFEDGYYSFETSLMDILHGTSTSPDSTKFVIDFDLYNDDGLPLGNKREFFTLFEHDGELTENAERSRTYLKRRLIDLGITGGLNGFKLEQGVGIQGTLQLQTSKGWQNIRNVKLAEQGAAEAEEAIGAKIPTVKRTATAGTKPNPFGKK